MDQFKQDKVYSEFLVDDFKLQTTMSLINNLPFTEQISKISSGIDQMKSNINQLTAKNCEALFQRTTKLNELYEELKLICIKSQNLSKTLEIIKSKFDLPYQQLSREIILLSRLQQTCDLLRKMLRIMYLIERSDETDLNSVESEQSTFLREVIKLSQYINEVDSILQTDSANLLYKLNPISKDLIKIDQTKNKLIDKMDSLFKKSLSSLDSNQIGVALQVYHNLRMLDQIVNDLISAKCQLIRESSFKLLDTLKMKESKSSIPLSKQNNLIRTSIRANCKCMMETVQISFAQVTTVVKILKKRRDNQTQTLLIEYIPDKDLILNFWNDIIVIFTEAFDKLFNSSAVIKKIIESEYPKILSLFQDYWKQFIHDEPQIKDGKSLRCTIELRPGRFN